MEFPEFLFTLLLPFSEIADGLNVRGTCKEGLKAWKLWRRYEPVDNHFWPSRTFVYLRRCVVCGKEGETMKKLVAPWSVFPPKSVYVVCADNVSCKYRALRVMARTNGTVFLTNKAFPDTVRIMRTNGESHKARCARRYMVRKDGELYLRTWWIDDEGLFQKLVLYEDVRSQELCAPRIVTHLF